MEGTFWTSSSPTFRNRTKVLVKWKKIQSMKKDDLNSKHCKSQKKEQNLHKLLSQVEGSYKLMKLLHVVEVINSGLYP